MSTFVKELESLISRHSIENGSDTPDFILAKYLEGCITLFDSTIQDREKFYGRAPIVVDVTSPAPKTNIEDYIRADVSDSEHRTSAALEQEVRDAIKADRNYPTGEPNAMKWAIAWRLIRDQSGFNANGDVHSDVDGMMCGWFANAMAAGEQQHLQRQWASGNDQPAETPAS